MAVPSVRFPAGILWLSVRDFSFVRQYTSSNNIKEVLVVMEKIVKERGTTVVMITHNAEIAKMADRVIKLRSGKIASVKRNLHPLPAAEIEW